MGKNLPFATLQYNFTFLETRVVNVWQQNQLSRVPLHLSAVHLVESSSLQDREGHFTLRPAEAKFISLVCLIANYYIIFIQDDESALSLEKNNENHFFA